MTVETPASSVLGLRTSVHGPFENGRRLPRAVCRLAGHSEDRAVRHVVDAQQFTREWLEGALFPTADRFRQMPPARLAHTLAGKRLFYLFYEPSPRTRVAFETAMTLLGGSVVGVDHQEHRPENERLEDRIQVLNQYPYDCILLRTHEADGAWRAATVSRVPVINAGDSGGQDPTQALLDAYTIYRECGRLDGLRVALVGDLSHERTTHALAYLLARCQGLKVYLVSPRLLRLRDDVREHLESQGAEIEEARDLRAVAGELDVLYLSRAHTPRLEHARRFETGPSGYAIDAQVLAQLPPHAVVLHPLPRGPELPAEYDSDPRVACFRQAQNGLFVRMALLALLVQQH